MDKKVRMEAERQIEELRKALEEVQTMTNRNNNSGNQGNQDNMRGSQENFGSQSDREFRQENRGGQHQRGGGDKEQLEQLRSEIVDYEVRIQDMEDVDTADLERELADVRRSLEGGSVDINEARDKVNNLREHIDQASSQAS